MHNNAIKFFISFLAIIVLSNTVKSQETVTDKVETIPSDFNTTAIEERILDPFEPINRVIFKFPFF